MKILDEFVNPDLSQGNDELERQVIDTLEWLEFFTFTFWLIHRIRVRHHLVSGVILVISSVTAFLVLINSDYGDDSFMVWSFWSLVAVVFLSLAKAIS